MLWKQFVVVVLLMAAIQEPKTGVSFPERVELQGKTLQLLGVGLKTKFMFKVYAEALYLESTASRALASSSPGEARFQAVVDGHFWKLFVLHFVRNVGYGKIQDAFKDGLALSMDVDSPDVRTDVQAFVNSFKSDVKKGQELKLLVEDSQVSVLSPDGKITVIKNARIAKGTTACWLGKNVEQGDLKNNLLNRFDLFTGQH